MWYLCYRSPWTADSVPITSSRPTSPSPRAQHLCHHENFYYCSIGACLCGCIVSCNNNKYYCDQDDRRKHRIYGRTQAFTNTAWPHRVLHDILRSRVRRHMQHHRQQVRYFYFSAVHSVEPSGWHRLHGSMGRDVLLRGNTWHADDDGENYDDDHSR